MLDSSLVGSKPRINQAIGAKQRRAQGEQDPTSHVLEAQAVTALGTVVERLQRSFAQRDGDDQESNSEDQAGP